VKAPTGNLWVRQADLTNPADARHYRDMLDAYAADPLGQGQPLEPEILDRTLADLAVLATARVFLAGIEDTTAGFATCFLGYSTFRAAPLLNIHDIAVLRGYRGRGIGRALLHAIAHAANEERCCKLTLEVRQDNAPAYALYRSDGFSAAIANGRPVQYFFLEKALPNRSA